jgi:hypothetical protein
MLVKITHPILYQDRVLLPGETTSVPASVGRVWLAQEWAAKVAEVSK